MKLQKIIKIKILLYFELKTKYTVFINNKNNDKK